MIKLLIPICALAVVGCESFTDSDTPPLVGSVQGKSPEAAVLFQKAQNYQAAGNTKNAIKTFRRVANNYPSDANAAEARFMEAYLLDQSGDPLESFDAYQKFINRYAGSPRYAQAVKSQEEVAYAAVNGTLKSNFLGLKSRIDEKKLVAMLEKLRDNAPQAASAPRAQYAIGQVLESRDKPKEAILAYEQLVSEYPKSGYAPEAQFRIGEILIKDSQSGNPDQANLERAKRAYNDLLLAYPSSPFAPQAKQRIATIGRSDLQASYNIAEFYRKKGQLASAAYYYQEVVTKAPAGPLRNQAAARLGEINR
ncbi:MAG: tetratricopeptide repeat protein [Verrucomicrobiota bacterium JB023]|nr:tetratricopeptide repeat protein [Verrucomicrobiota bacterium JB023]